MESFLSFSRWVDHATAGLKGGRKHRERAFFALPPIQTRLATPSLEKSRCAVKTIPRKPELADSSSINAVSFSSVRTTKRFPSPRCASAIQIVRPLESIAKTQPQLQPALLQIVSDDFRIVRRFHRL